MTVFREARLGKQKLRTMDGNADALGVVPAHTYARLRFDEAAEQAVQHLGYVLQMHQGSPYQGQFVAQSEQRAGASSRAFPGPDGRDNPRGGRAKKHSFASGVASLRADEPPSNGAVRFDRRA